MRKLIQCYELTLYNSYSSTHYKFMTSPHQITYEDISKLITPQDFTNTQPFIAYKVHGQKYVNNMLLYLVEWEHFPFPECFTWEINQYLRYDFDLMTEYTKAPSTIKKSKPSQKSLVLKKHNRFAIVSYDPAKFDKAYETKTRKHIAKFLASKQFTEQIDGKKYKIIQTKDSDLTTKISIKILSSPDGQKMRTLVPFQINNQAIDQQTAEIHKYSLPVCKVLYEEEDFMNQIIDLGGHKTFREQSKMVDENVKIQSIGEIMIEGHQINKNRMIYIVKGVGSKRVKRVSAQQLSRLNCSSIVVQYLQRFMR